MGAVATHAASREGLGWRFAARARTSNMYSMLVTLDVSKLSGWLNVSAFLNMWLMSVTPEVFQLEMSAYFKMFARSRKSSLMSVMPETSQVLGKLPYFEKATIALSLYSPSAVFSSALVAKTVVRRRPLVVATGVLAARITGSHCGGHATGWLASASLLATLDSVMCGRKAARNAAAAPKRTSTRKLEACFFAWARAWEEGEG